MSLDDTAEAALMANGSSPHPLNGKSSENSSSRSRVPSPDPLEDDPHLLMIESLRNQNNELFAQVRPASLVIILRPALRNSCFACVQVTALNSKLVKSYDRVSDLEDSQHVTQSALRTSSLRITQLEQEKTEHLSALDTGLLVERAHVTTELTRLMEKATEEAAQRGQAETAKHEIEKVRSQCVVLCTFLFSFCNSSVYRISMTSVPHCSVRRTPWSQKHVTPEL